MRQRPTKFNDIPTELDAWLDELEYWPDDRCFEASDCAELADELALFAAQAGADDDFWASMAFWEECIWEHSLWLAIEQCCHDGVLLPPEQRAIRVKTCPTEILDKLGYFFGKCPRHVMHHLALRFWVAVRVDRALRTGSPEWRPSSPPARKPYHDTVFFKPPILKFRTYAR